MDRSNATPVPTTIETIPQRDNSRSLSKRPKANPRNGNIIGATNMAPIITAVLLLNNPKVAIKQAVITKIM